MGRTERMEGPEVAKRPSSRVECQEKGQAACDRYRGKNPKGDLQKKSERVELKLKNVWSQNKNGSLHGGDELKRHRDEGKS